MAIVKNNKFNEIDIFLRKIPDNHLFTICEEVTNFDKKLAHIIELMISIMDGCGEKVLSANQVGFDKRIIVIKYGDEMYFAMINPEISYLDSGYVNVLEECASLPNYKVSIKRPLKIRVSCRDVTGKRNVFDAENELAYHIVHGVEHLDGVLISNYDANFNE